MGWWSGRLVKVIIGYIVHNLNDPAVERRCKMLQAGGATVKLAGFCREPHLHADIAARAPLLLGGASDAALVRRAIATLVTAITNRTLRHHMADADVVMARNLEQLGIARAIVGGRPLVYECLDIHRSLTGSSLPARAIQAVEAKLLPRVDLLLTSSPAFLLNHFDQRPLTAPSYLVENKLLDLMGVFPLGRPTQLREPGPITIGWFGMLRCRTTFQTLQDVARSLDGAVEVLICGKPSPAELPDLASDAAATPHMRFTGPYTYDQLPDLYGRCDFAWTIDWFEEGLNSSWLLPNRLYEALAFHTTPIALRNIEIGRWLHRHDAGLLIDNPDSIIPRLRSLTPEDLHAMQQAAARIDPEELIATLTDCHALTNRIGAVRR